jgi:hypothetical protein
MPIRLRRAQTLVGFAGVEREAQRPRIGQADVRDGDAHQPAADIERIRTTVQHAA